MIRATALGMVMLALLVPSWRSGPPAQQAPDLRALTADLSASDPVTRARAACGLRDLGDAAAPAIASLIALLGDGAPVGEDVCQRWRQGTDGEPTSPGELAAAALVAIGSRSVEPLLDAVKSTASLARRHAAWALGALDDSRAEQPLVTLLRDAEARVREQAAWALGVLDASAAVQPLIGCLEDDDRRVRRQAAWALGVIDAPEAVPALVAGLKDADPGVRRHSAWALGVIGDHRALNELLVALKDPAAEVRRQAAWAIGVIGG